MRPLHPDIQYINMRMCCRRWTLQSIPGHLNWHLTSHRYTAALQSAQIAHPWPKCNVKLHDRHESYFCSNFLHVSQLRSADGCEEAAGPRLLKEEAMSPDRFWHLLQVRLACAHWGCLSHRLVGSVSWGRCWFVYLPSDYWYSSNWNACARY